MVSFTADSVVESAVVRTIESTIEPATEYYAAASAAETESTTVSAAESIIVSAAESIIEFTVAKSTVSYAVESDVVPDVESEPGSGTPHALCVVLPPSTR